MPLKPFDFKALTELDDGRIGKTIDQALDRMYADLDDRPLSDKERSITLKISLAPVADDKGLLDDVDVAFKIVEKVPQRESKTYRMQARNGALLFNEMSPDDPDQQTLDGLDGKGPLRRVGS